MALANILNAKRLNPQVRKPGDQTLVKVGFKTLLKDGISNHGKIVIKQLDAVRLRIAKDPNLVIAEGADTTIALSLVAEYIATLKDLMSAFQRTPEDIDDDNITGQAALDEMIELESELLSIQTYCRVHMVALPAAEEEIPVQKLKAQNFPKFDGTDDGTTFLIWQDHIRKMMPKIRDPAEKKNPPPRMFDRWCKGFY